MTGRVPGFLLRAIVALLPRRRRQWGDAMRAELAHLDDSSGRWSFVAGCLRATISTTTPGAIAGIVASAASIVGAVVLTARTGYPPLRWALVAYVALLVGLAWSGRWSAWAPAGRRAEWLRFGGLALIAVLATTVVNGLGTGGDPADRAAAGVPIMAVVSACYLVALLTVSADRGAGAGFRGAGVGTVVGALWTAGVLVFPPVPAGVSTALLSVLVAMAAAGLRHRRRGAGSTARDALAAAATCALVIVVAVRLVGAGAPARFIPMLPGSTALTHAAAMTQSRTEMGDPYVAILLLGAVAAALLIATRIRAAAAPHPTPAISTI
jgi:hypothetical protein